MYRRMFGGGSSGGAKTGEIADWSGNTVTISTGLSSIKRFSLVGYNKRSTTPTIFVVSYDYDVDSTHYATFSLVAPTTSSAQLSSTSGYGATFLTLGTTATATANFSIISISGGDVQILCPNNASYSTSLVPHKVYWYAE